MHSYKLTRILCVIIIVLLVLNSVLIIGLGIRNRYREANEDISVSEPDESIEFNLYIEPSTEPSVEVVTEVTTEPITEPSSEATAEPEVTEDVTEPTINQQDLEHLAIIIYREAGGDACCNECRRRIADVVLNRVADDRFENTIEEVLLSPHQFGKLYKTGLVWPERASKPEEKHAVERAYQIAEEVLQGKHSNVYQKGYVWFQMAKRTDDYIVCYVCGFYYSR